MEQMNMEVASPADYEDTPLTRDLKVPLTHVEIAAKGNEAGGLKAEIMDLQSAFDKTKKEFNAEVGARMARIWTLLGHCKEGKEEKTVTCIQRKNYAACTVQYIYDGEVLEERAMTTDELQRDLFKSEPREVESEEMPGIPLPIGEQVAQDIRESTSIHTATSAIDSFPDQIETGEV